MYIVSNLKSKSMKFTSANCYYMGWVWQQSCWEPGDVDVQVQELPYHVQVVHLAGLAVYHILYYDRFEDLCILIVDKKKIIDKKKTILLLDIIKHTHSKSTTHRHCLVWLYTMHTQKWDIFLVFQLSHCQSCIITTFVWVVFHRQECKFNRIEVWGVWQKKFALHSIVW